MPPIECIARAVIVEQGHVLLCQNRKRGYFYLPGGHIEFSESAAQAAARELMEEAGLTIKPRECLCVQEHVFTQKGRRRHEVNVLLGAGISGKRRALAPVDSLEEHIAFSWVSVADLKSIDLRPEHHVHTIARAAAGDRSCAFDSRTG